MEVYHQKKSKAVQVLAAICVVLVLGMGAFAYLAWQAKQDADSATSKQEGLQTQLDTLRSTTPSPTASSTSPTPETSSQQTTVKTKLYFGTGWEGKYTLTDLTSGKSRDFVPDGYEIVAQHEYEQEPAFLVLRKDGSLFSYDVSSTTVKRIELPTKLTSAHNIVLNPSISEKNKFYIVIQETKESDGMLGYEVLGSNSYFYNATTNILQTNSDLALPGGSKASGCFEYDSQFNRFFNWNCGEGIGQALPLSVYDINAQSTTTVMSSMDFDLTTNENELVSVKYNNGYFIGVPRVKDKASKVVIIKAESTINKEVLSISNSIKNSLYSSNGGHYGYLYAPEYSSLVIGGDNNIKILTIRSKNITAIKEFPEKEVYANFLYSKDGKLYFRNKGAIKIVNLSSNKIDQTFNTDTNEPITLISLPE